MKQTVSIFLSLLLLLSSTGISYAEHYCGSFKMMSEITLGHEHLSCGMKMEAHPCGDEKEDHFCCNNEYTDVDTDDSYAKATFDIQFEQNFLIAFVSVFVLNTLDNYESNTHFFRDYSPPPLGEDLQVLYETFLI